ncbi:MAG: hypothetical protein UY73_C0004G0010 [Parcubacteria group bacterium GW2011_GWA2_52_8]|nr:MAG: hypothetical protein UY73_C0004G0010 [Parcubacteria group bacterium GW2011_GWA2_52_8]
MKTFAIRSRYGKIRFELLNDKAPATCKAFLKRLPFKTPGVQARFAGEEIWAPKGPLLNVRRENATRRPRFGEVGYVVSEKRSALSGSIALVYGEAYLSASANVFAKVHKADKLKLKRLGKKIWLRGQTVLGFNV